MAADAVEPEMVSLEMEQVKTRATVPALNIQKVEADETGNGRFIVTALPADFTPDFFTGKVSYSIALRVQKAYDAEAVSYTHLDGNATYTGQKKYSYTWTGGGTGAGIKTNGNAALKDCFVVSIWNDDPQNWKVELVQNGVVTPMSRISSNIADMCAVSFFFNECGKTTTTWNKALQH